MNYSLALGLGTRHMSFGFRGILDAGGTWERLAREVQQLALSRGLVLYVA